MNKAKNYKQKCSLGSHEHAYWRIYASSLIFKSACNVIGLLYDFIAPDKTRLWLIKLRVDNICVSFGKRVFLSDSDSDN